MSIKYERPSPRRMMMHFDREFLDSLPLFKGGLQGNEMDVLYDELRALKLESRPGQQILDVGSADGDWLRKTASDVWSKLDLHRARFTALEPIDDNPKLARFCRENDVTWAQSRIEESQLPDESFDIITSTHTAYYYYNQPLAHEELYRLLKPNGILIVTLVSQFCALNLLTQEILEPHKQFTLNAESYLTMISKLGLFSLEKVRSFKGGTVDDTYYTATDDNLKALEHVLARHRLPSQDVDRSRDILASALKKYRGRERVNLVMFFEKVRTSSPTQIANLGPEQRDIEARLETVRADVQEAAEQFTGDKREVLEADLESFSREARSRPIRSASLHTSAERLARDLHEGRGNVNNLIDKINGLVSKLKSSS